MPLITCPDCTREHSDLAPSCPQCGRPNGAVAVAAQRPVPVVPIAPGPRSAHACPGCGSENVQKLSVIFQHGTAMVNTVTGGMMVGGAGMNAMGARTGGTSQSLLSAAAAPPQRRTVSGGWVVLLVVGVIVLISGAGSGSAGSIVFGLVMMGIPIAVMVSVGQWNREQFPQLYAHWDATFQCTRCGVRFVPQR